MHHPSELIEKPPRSLATYVGCFGIAAIFVVLICLLVPGRGAQEASFKFYARDDERHIIAAIKAYYNEYGAFPVDPKASGVVVFSRDNHLLFDVLRDRTGAKPGNALNPRDITILEVHSVANPSRPRLGLQASTGVWYDPWGSPYCIAIDTNKRGGIDGKAIPNFYSDVGLVKGLDVIVWSCGKNGTPGGGPAANANFSNETGTPGKLAGSEDVVSWK